MMTFSPSPRFVAGFIASVTVLGTAVLLLLGPGGADWGGNVEVQTSPVITGTPRLPVSSLGARAVARR